MTAPGGLTGAALVAPVASGISTSALGAHLSSFADFGTS
jgi:hypothetical protein